MPMVMAQPVEGYGRAMGQPVSGSAIHMAQPVEAYGQPMGQPVVASMIQTVIMPQQNVVDDLTRLAELHRIGQLTEAEFEDAKARVLQRF